MFVLESGRGALVVLLGGTGLGAGLTGVEGEPPPQEEGPRLLWGDLELSFPPGQGSSTEASSALA